MTNRQAALQGGFFCAALDPWDGAMFPDAFPCKLAMFRAVHSSLLETSHRPWPLPEKPWQWRQSWPEKKLKAEMEKCEAQS